MRNAALEKKTQTRNAAVSSSSSLGGRAAAFWFQSGQSKGRRKKVPSFLFKMEKKILYAVRSETLSYHQICAHVPPVLFIFFSCQAWLLKKKKRVETFISCDSGLPC